MNITCEKIEKESKHLLMNLFELYVYECSSFVEEGFLELNNEGLYRFPKQDSYFADTAYDLYLVRVDQQLAGFVIVRKLYENDTIIHRMEQFFVLKKFHRKGVGRAIAKQIFARYPGRWRVDQIEKNYPAQAFWRNVIKEYTDDFYVEKYVNHKAVQEFLSVENPFISHVNQDITLKLLLKSDVEPLFDLVDQSRNYLREWLPWVDGSKIVDDTQLFVRANFKQFMENDGFSTGIWYKGELAGSIGFHQIRWDNRSTSIGYWLGERFQGNGIMTQSVQAMIDYAFKQLKLNRVEIRVAPENKKSGAIPERLGFQKEGCIREAEWLNDHFVDHDVYGMLKKDWKIRNSIEK